jgi:hypothetical protein
LCYNGFVKLNFSEFMVLRVSKGHKPEQQMLTGYSGKQLCLPDWKGDYSNLWELFAFPEFTVLAFSGVRIFIIYNSNMFYLTGMSSNIIRKD